MGISPEAQRRIDQEKRLVEQIIHEPNFQLSGVVFRPYTSFLRSNNFVQQTASRMFAYNPTDEKWTRVYTDSEGRLVLSPQDSEGAQVYLRDREFVTNTIFDGHVLPTGGAYSHVGIDASGYIKKSILIESNVTVTVHLQASTDNVYWYDLVDTNGNAVTFSVSNERKSFANDDACRYFRIVIENTSGSDATLKAYIVGQT